MGRRKGERNIVPFGETNRVVGTLPANSSLLRATGQDTWEGQEKFTSINKSSHMVRSAIFYKSSHPLKKTREALYCLKSQIVSVILYLRVKLFIEDKICPCRAYEFSCPYMVLSVRVILTSQVVLWRWYLVQCQWVLPFLRYLPRNKLTTSSSFLLVSMVESPELPWRDIE